MTPLLLNKPKGITPLACIHAFKTKYPQYQEQTLSFAGRLDPMAEGLLLILVGEENKQRKAYEEMEKTYEFSLLCGVATDTYDILGKVTAAVETIPEIALQPQKYTTTFLQEYPPYSSKPVAGKPLYWWAREGKLSEITIPSKEITISSFTLLSSSSLTKENLKAQIFTDLKLVSGDFRQEEIKKEWEIFFNQTPLSHFPLYTFTLTCTSGTYVRGLCNQIGKDLGVPSLAYSIKRTAIGSHSLADAIQI